MLNNNMQSNLRNNLSRLEKVQNHLATGKLINKPSDNPIGISYSMRYRSELAATEQYQSNLNIGLSWLEQTDTMLNQATNIVHRAKDLALSGASSEKNQPARDAIAAEIDELFQQLKDIANSQLNGRYIFNGQKTDQAPYPNDDSYQNASFDKGDISFELSRGIVIQVNVDAGSIFGEVNDADNIFATLANISEALKSGETETVRQLSGNLDSRLETMLNSWSEVGAKTNRVELIDERLKDSNLNLQDLISKTEDADLAEVIMRLKIEESVYQASLASGARIIMPSLIDFLR
ncbi:flagellar hook-associated protein 3 FlgL [Bacillus horti]|uniref:Flagellar hook-associated protein 3 FlgL n=2 Tax=Caldalkalibacillus horti TaxID=77523 RepID=A0ABT9VZB7_9BACI|nr:flagellar hook-associated protein 3 FlgL [Bacillus horti]